MERTAIPASIAVQRRAESGQPSGSNGDPATHFTSSNYTRGFLLLLFVGLALYGAYLFLNWRRRKSGYASNLGRGLLGRFGGGNEAHSTEGYDPLANQQFAFDEELDLELNSYNFGGEAGAHPYGGVKLRAGSSAAGWEKGVYGYGQGGRNTGQQPDGHSTRARTANAPSLAAHRPTPLEIGNADTEDADELLRW
ncbi:hypothetical protein SpCBS45565_g01754 [Spizellomyces sp. 'palustris']|nr:hypothetical protein SpCBS45565_g01754 [Spizellomyces sp. 'palustris']